RISIQIPITSPERLAAFAGPSMVRTLMLNSQGFERKHSKPCECFNLFFGISSRNKSALALFQYQLHWPDTKGHFTYELSWRKMLCEFLKEDWFYECHLLCPTRTYHPHD